MASSSSSHSNNNSSHHGGNLVGVEEEDEQVVLDFPPYIKLYKSGRFERYTKWTWVPPSAAPDQPVLSKDVLIDPETGLTARLFLPTAAATATEIIKESSVVVTPAPSSSSLLPLLIYFHGGAYVIESAYSTIFNSFVSTLVAESNVVALSVEYPIAPERPIGACYNESWKAVQWALSHSDGDGPDPWLNKYFDFNKVFFGGDSAGGSISSNMAWRTGTTTSSSTSISTVLAGILLIHPFFGNDYENPRIWPLFCPDSEGIFDPRLNPAAHPEVMAALACKRALVCVAEKDNLKDRGMRYYEALKKSGWKGEAELFESKGEGHDFHLFHPQTENARHLRNKIADFLNHP